MDFIAELVLAYVDELVTLELGDPTSFHILRYRDDYRIFTNSDVDGERILKVISDKLREVGMRLGVAKTVVSGNVVEGSIKADKLAGIALQDLGESNAKTVQKQLLRLHSFGQSYPNSGALRRLLSSLHEGTSKEKFKTKDLEVQVAILTDIAVTSPLAFPAVAGIISNLLAAAEEADRIEIWEKVSKKMKRVPYNGYLEVWLQRVIKPKGVGIDFFSEEAICRMVNKEALSLWNNEWIASKGLKDALGLSIVVSNPEEMMPEIDPSELAIFKINAEMY